MRRLGGSLLAIALAILARGPAHAGEMRELYRGSRSLAMGGAGLALADDVEAIFMNPAGLAGVENTEVHYATVDIQASNDIFTTFQNQAAFKNFSADKINKVMGKSMYARAQAAPAFVMKYVGVAALVDAQGMLKVENQSLPQITIGYQQTNGVQMSTGFSLNPPGRHRTKNEFRIGFGAKTMWRRGGYNLLPLIYLFNLSKDTLKAVAGTSAFGFGADTAFQYIMRASSHLTFYAGTVYTEVGDIAFGTGSSQPQKGNLGIGGAMQYKVRFTKVSIAYDYRRILDDTDWRKKNHVGIEWDLPIITLYGGINQVYFSYGLSADLWLFKATALTYAEEEGSFVHIDPDRRFMVRLDFSLSL